MNARVRNSLTKTECAIRRIPEKSRKDFCRQIEEALKEPKNYIFYSLDDTSKKSFHLISELYTDLSDSEKEEFTEEFSELVKQFR